MKHADESLKKFSATSSKLGQMWGNLSNKANRWGKEFTMVGLGVMFFGMMIKKAFIDIAKVGLKTFKDITQGAGMLNQGLAKLEAAWTFLKFSVGNAIAVALQPLIPMIFGIVVAIAEWINKNPELTAKIIAWGAALGATLFVLGSFGLGLQGVANFLRLLIGNKLFDGFLMPFMRLLLFVIGLMAIWKSQTISAVDKIGLSFILLAALLKALGLGWWGLIALLIGLVIVFRKRIALEVSILGLQFRKLTGEMQQDWQDLMMGLVESFMAGANWIVDKWNSVFGRFLSLPTIDWETAGLNVIMGQYSKLSNEIGKTSTAIEILKGKRKELKFADIAKESILGPLKQQFDGMKSEFVDMQDQAGLTAGNKLMTLADPTQAADSIDSLKGTVATQAAGIQSAAAGDKVPQNNYTFETVNVNAVGEDAAGFADSFMTSITQYTGGGT